MSAAAAVEADAVAGVERDMFEEAPDQAQEDLAAAVKSTRMSFVGVLEHDAELRYRPNTCGGHAIPVVCIDVVVDSPIRHVVHAERVFTDATREKAEQLVSTLTRGRRVRVASPLLGVRVSLPDAEIDLSQPE